MNKKICSDFIISRISSLSEEELQVRRVERKKKRAEEKQKEKQKLEAYKKILERKRQELFNSTLKPMIEKAKSLSSSDAEQLLMEMQAEWEINPHFVNSCGGGNSSSPEHSNETEVVSSKCDQKEAIKNNWDFIEKYAGQKFSTYEKAQEFMLQDAQKRRTKIRQKSSHENDWEVAKIESSFRLEHSLDKIMKDM